MRNFFLALAVLFGLTCIAKADECGPGTHPVAGSNIVCNYVYSPSTGWLYLCYNDFTCEPNDGGCFDSTPGLCAPPVWQPDGYVNQDRKRIRVSLHRA